MTSRRKLIRRPLLLLKMKRRPLWMVILLNWHRWQPLDLHSTSCKQCGLCCWVLSNSIPFWNRLRSWKQKERMKFSKRASKSEHVVVYGKDLWREGSVSLNNSKWYAYIPKNGRTRYINFLLVDCFCSIKISQHYYCSQHSNKRSQHYYNIATSS